MTARHNLPLLVFLVFPLIGLLAMVTIILGNRDASEKASQESLPTPAPLRTTPVPTVTPVSVLDNPAPDLPLKTLDDQPFKLFDLKGKPVVVNFWATWCPPCVREMPTLEKFAQDHPEVIVLAVADPSDGQTIEDIRAFLEAYYLDSLMIGLDQNGMLRLNFYAFQLPMTFVLDSEGIVRFRQIGEVTREDLDYYLSQLS